MKGSFLSCGLFSKIEELFKIKIDFFEVGEALNISGGVFKIMIELFDIWAFYDLVDSF